MQTIEAVISLVFLILICSTILLTMPEQRIDDSIYRMQLAEDVWRVLYLRGDLNGFSSSQSIVKKASETKIENDLDVIGSEMGLCIYMSGIQMTNCRDGIAGREKIVSIERMLVDNGEPRKIMLSLEK